MKRVVCLFAIGFFSGLYADPAYFTGTVIDSAGNPVAGAQITIRSTGGGGGGTLTATTDAQGKYSINATVGSGGSVHETTVASAAGYANDTLLYIIAATGDGLPDTIIQNFTMYEGNFHMFVVRGTTLDSAGKALANVMAVTWINQGYGVGEMIDTCYSTADGTFADTLLVHFTINTLSCTVSLTGYVGTSVSKFLPPGNSITLAALKLTKIFVIDSLNYQISGSIVSSAGGNVPSPQVIVTATEGGSTFISATLNPTLGFYSASSGKIPRRQGSISVRVAATATGYGSVTIDTVIPWSLAQTNINVIMRPTSVIVPLTMHLPGDDGPGILVTCSGRSAGRIQASPSRAAVAGGVACQPLIVVRKEMSPAQRCLVVPGGRRDPLHH